MLTVGIIVLAVLVLAGVVILWRSSAGKTGESHEDAPRPRWPLTDFNAYWGDQVYRRRHRKR